MVKTGSRISALALRARARRTQITDIDAAPARDERPIKRTNTEARLGRVSRRLQLQVIETVGSTKNN